MDLHSLLIDTQHPQPLLSFLPNPPCPRIIKLILRAVRVVILVLVPLLDEAAGRGYDGLAGRSLIPPPWLTIPPPRLPSPKRRSSSSSNHDDPRLACSLSRVQEGGIRRCEGAFVSHLELPTVALLLCFVEGFVEGPV